jgi:hypothetical protein
MTGHSLDVRVRHYVGRFGPAKDARARLLDAGLGGITDQANDDNAEEARP